MRWQIADFGSGACVDFRTFAVMTKKIVAVAVFSRAARTFAAFLDAFEIRNIAHIGLVETVFVAALPRRAVADDTKAVIVACHPVGTAFEKASLHAFAGLGIAFPVIRAAIG